MKIPQLLVAHCALLVACSALAGRNPGVSMSAFNAVVPASAANAVFSPFAFELDCAVISEAFAPIGKAKYVETLGALLGYENVYRPLMERYAGARTNALDLVSARAWLTTSLAIVTPKYRSYIQGEYGVCTCPVRPSSEGAESFLKAAMDGEMEDFRVPAVNFGAKGVAFCDLESFHCAFAEPFPTANTRELGFTRADGTRAMVPMMCDLRVVDLWSPGRFTLLRLPLADGAWLFVALPDAGVPLESIRGTFAADKFDEAVIAFKAVADPAVYRGSAALAIPKLAIDASLDLAPAFSAFALPTAGFKEIFLGANAPLSAVWQRTRFVLDERGADGNFLRAKASADETRAEASTRKFVCDRPFLFFVYHEPTRTVPVAGVFAGDVISRK